MTSIFDLQDELLHLRHVLEMESEGEINPALAEWLTSKEDELERKVEGYCSVIGELEAMADARKIEARRIADLGTVDANKAHRMREVLREVFQKLSIPRMETTRYKLRLQNAGGKQRITVDPFETVPNEFTKTMVEPDLDKVRQVLEAGQSLPFATLVPRSQVLIIK